MASPPMDERKTVMALKSAHSARFNPLRRFRGDRRASAAIEFAITAPIFLVMVFAILETALVFFAGQVLETGLQQSARLMFTGQASANAMTQAQFQTDLCSRVSALLTCSNLYIDVQSYPSGTAINIVDPIVAGVCPTTGFSYQDPPPNSSNTVVVRAFYQWQLFVTGLGFNISNCAGSKRLLAATSAFHVEPR
jgi:Flp pilus assembly protein TadG